MLWFKIIRPQTLFASFCPVATALIIVSQTSQLHIPVAIATILCALSLQILSNLINDYYDFKRGTDKKGRVGFKRALAEGLVTEKQMLIACCLTLAISLALGLYLVIIGGWVILLIGVLAIFFAWLYTATNHSLSYLGIADIFVFLFYGVIAGWGTGFLQFASMGESPSIIVSRLSALNTTLILASAVNGLISMCVLIINNLRDIESDTEAGKRTFPVRFGKRAGELGMLLIVILMPVFAWFAYCHWLPMLIFIPAFLLFIAVTRAQGSQYNKCLLCAGITNVIYVALVMINYALQ